MEGQWLHAKVVEIRMNVPLQAGDEVLIHTHDIKVAVKDNQGRWSFHMHDWGSFRVEALKTYSTFPLHLMKASEAIEVTKEA